MIIACVTLYFVLLLGLLVACLLRRIGWRWLLAAAIPLFVTAAVMCLGVLLVALLGRGGRNQGIHAQEGRATGLPWRRLLANPRVGDASTDSRLWTDSRWARRL